MTKIPVSEAGPELEDLVRRASRGRETIALTDHDQVVALLVSPQVIEDLEDSLAVADYRRRKAEGTLGEGIPHEEVRRVLGLSPSAACQPTGSRNSSRFPTGS
ncbi:type II toxin-antitoxin system prevent-host-death family antitoxin [Streptomyces sp. NPDC006356]